MDIHLVRIVSCCICSKILNPLRNEYKTVIYRDENGKETDKYVCTRCPDKFNTAYKDKIFCIICSNLVTSDQFSFVFTIKDNTNTVFIANCSEKCMSKAVKKCKKDKELGLEFKCPCGKKDKEMKKCGRCKKIYYCSKECQIKDWQNHKSECKT